MGYQKHVGFLSFHLRIFLKGKMKNPLEAVSTGGILFVIGFGLLIALSPLVAIWSLNTLFGVGIPYTLKTYFAALFLTPIAYGRGGRKD